MGDPGTKPTLMLAGLLAIMASHTVRGVMTRSINNMSARPAGDDMYGCDSSEVHAKRLAAYVKLSGRPSDDTCQDKWSTVYCEEIIQIPPADLVYEVSIMVPPMKKQIFASMFKVDCWKGRNLSLEVKGQIG
jgi:hypothetical protein